VVEGGDVGKTEERQEEPRRTDEPQEAGLNSISQISVPPTFVAEFPRYPDWLSQ